MTWNRVVFGCLRSYGKCTAHPFLDAPRHQAKAHRKLTLSAVPRSVLSAFQQKHELQVQWQCWMSDGSRGYLIASKDSTEILGVLGVKISSAFSQHVTLLSLLLPFYWSWKKREFSASLSHVNPNQSNSINESVNQSITQWINQYINWSINRPNSPHEKRKLPFSSIFTAVPGEPSNFWQMHFSSVGSFPSILPGKR